MPMALKVVSEARNRGGVAGVFTRWVSRSNANQGMHTYTHTQHNHTEVTARIQRLLTGLGAGTRAAAPNKPPPPPALGPR